MNPARKRIRASVICVRDGRILVFKAVDPHSKKNYWFLPGGKIEANEKPWQCVHREALEETGYEIEIAIESELVKEYSHEWNGELYECKTYFYKGVLADPSREPMPVADASYNHGAEWLPLAAAIEFFGYNEAIQSAVLALSK